MKYALPILESARASAAGPVSTGKMRFHMLVKPEGAACNLKCDYCFYLHKTQSLEQARLPRMSDEVLEEHIRQYLDAHQGNEAVFSWQGGEPTLAGIDFFRKVVELQAKHRSQGQRICNDLQTNGTLLDDEWAAFLKAHDFLVGLSCDGPRCLHDRFRVNHVGAPTFDRVLAAARLLNKHRVPFNALCVINRENARYPLDVYRFLTREFGTRRIQFIPCVEPRTFESCAPRAGGPVVGTPESRPGHPDSIVTDWSVDPVEWGEFLCRVWDDWMRRDLGRVFVNLFETAAAQSVGQPAQVCTQAEFCGKATVLEHNGDVFSCDHFVYPEYQLGNIRSSHETDMVSSSRQVNFGMNKSNTLPAQCLACPHLNLCWGECPRNRIIRTPDGEPGLNYLCSGFQRFYAHIRRDLPVIVSQTANEATGRWRSAKTRSPIEAKY